EWVHVQLHQQKGMISLSPPTICNSAENHSYRASGLTLLTAAISLWNTVYMERAVDALKRKGVKINEQLLSHLSPLGWEHINLTGDYIWKSNRIPASGKFRRLRPAKVERSKNSLNVQ
ncbi:Tn3 family transposase, partial [Klebsiella pneumoniae]|uniref:Tn3 family transposase n=1 Tax=Klebsiella pneumoniae TaxID=573 RepID=UPI00363A8041